MNIIYSPAEITAIGIVLVLVELLKPKVNSKYYRYLSLPFGFFMAACIIIENNSGFPGFWVFLAQEIQIGLKITFGAMGFFDLFLKPKKPSGEDVAEQEKKEGLR